MMMTQHSSSSSSSSVTTHGFFPLDLGFCGVVWVSEYFLVKRAIINLFNALNTDDALQHIVTPQVNIRHER